MKLNPGHAPLARILACGGIAALGVSSAVAAQAPRFRSIESSKITLPCSTTVPPTTSITLQLQPTFWKNLTSNTRCVTGQSPVCIYGAVLQPTIPPGATPFDMIFSGKAGLTIQITVELPLNTPQIGFYSSNGTDPSMAIEQGNTNSGLTFSCLKPITPATSTTPSSVSFQVQFSTTMPAAGSINIGLQFNMGNDSNNIAIVLPVIIDPKIVNNG